MIDYTQEIAEAAAYVREKLDLGGQGVDIGIVLGSALGGFTDKLSEKKELSYSNIPHMPGTSVIGHSGNLYSGKVGGKHIICFSGRVHSYEGIPLHKVCFQVRLMAALQCKLYILTNASGGAGEGMMPGSLVALRDHINFARIDPMNEFYDEFIKNRYVSSKSIWSNRCCEVAHQVASEMGIKLFDGVYCWTSGPSFETPLEVATGVKSGAVCFGMSTVPEALTAKACGMEVFGLSLATNLAAGISEQDLSHDDVKETASLHGDSFQKFLENVLSKLDVIDTKVESSSEAPLIFESVPAWTRDTAQDFATSVGHQFDSKTFNKAIIATSGVDYSIDKLLSNPKTLQLSKLNGFPVVSKAGHNGKLVSGGYNGEQVVAIVSGHGEGFHATEASFLVEVLYFLGVTQSVLVLSSATTDPSKENGIKTSFVNGIIDLSRGLHVDTLQQHFEPASEYPDLVTKRTRNIAQQHNMPACNHAVFTGPCFPSTAELRMAKMLGASSVNTNAATFAFGLRYLGIDNAILTAAVTLEDHDQMNIFQVEKALRSAADSSVTESIAKFISEPAPERVNSNVLTQKLLPSFKPFPATYQQVQQEVEYIKSHLNMEVPQLAILDFNVHSDLPANPISPEIPLDRLSHNFHRTRSAAQLRVVEINGVQSVLVSNCGQANEPSNLNNLTTLVRVLHHLGIRHMLFLSVMKDTNPSSTTTEVCLVADHANFTGVNPLTGENDSRWGTRFPSMDRAYDKDQQIAIQQGMGDAKLRSIKVFYQVSMGPVFDPAILEAVSLFGADALAQVTIPESIVARHMGISVASVAVVRGYRASDPVSQETSGQIGRAVTAWTQRHGTH